MGLTRKELDRIYQYEKNKYKRINGRDIDIIKGIDVLYTAILDYIDGECDVSNKK